MKIFKKIEVNGANQHPLFTYLKSQCPATRDFFATKEKLFYNPLNNNDIRWNFEKFLINRQGKPVRRYDAGFEPKKMVDDIENELNQQQQSEISNSELYVNVYYN